MEKKNLDSGLVLDEVKNERKKITIGKHRALSSLCASCNQWCTYRDSLIYERKKPVLVYILLILYYFPFYTYNYLFAFIIKDGNCKKTFVDTVSINFTKIYKCSKINK